MDTKNTDPEGYSEIVEKPTEPETPQDIAFKNIVKRMKEAQGLEEDADYYRILHPISNYMSAEEIRALPKPTQQKIVDARVKRQKRQARNKRWYGV